MIAATLGFAGGLVEAPRAFVEATQNGELEIPLPMQDHDPYMHRSAATITASTTMEEALSSRLAGEARVVGWNAATQTPHLVWTDGIEVGAALSTHADVESSARAFMSAEPDVFGLPAGHELVLWDVRENDKRAVAHFEQRYHGIPVIGGRAWVNFWRDRGSVTSFSSDLYSDIDVNPSPALSAGAATDIARDAVPFDPHTDRLDGETELLVLPVLTSPVDVEHHLVWRVRVRTEEPLGIWVTHVDAHSGEIIWRYNDIHFLDVSGDATSSVQDKTYCNGAGDQASHYLRVDVTGLGTVITDMDGNWNAGDGGTGTRTVSGDMEGPYVDLNNIQGAEAFFSGTATAGTPFPVVWDDSNSRADERDVFDAINDVHDFFEIFDPGYGYANFQIDANVNRSQTCNAYWDGTINFYNAGGGCANTGEIQGVAHHEFGHGVQNDLIGSQGGQGLGEGNSDVLANLITQESIIGRGFNTGNCSGGIRDSDNSLTYPEDVSGQGVHAAGRVIAGFHWDIMIAMQAEYGVEEGTIRSAELWHYARKMSAPTSQPAQVTAVYEEDDDNGDLLDGTPNCDILNQAAINHGYDGDVPQVPVPCGVVIVHQRLDSRTTGGNVTIEAQVSSVEAPIDPGTVSINYSLNGGGFTQVVMDDLGGGAYSGVISGLDSADEVSYYLSAEDEGGGDGELPFGAPTLGTYGFDIATVWHDHESDHGWIVNPDGTDTATTGIWERVDPNPTDAAPGDDHTSFGTMCFITGQGSVGGGLGDDDIDGGATTLQTPPFDLTGAAVAKVKYRRWYSNDTGATPGTDFWVVRVRNDGGPWQDIENTNVSNASWVTVEDDLVARFGTVGVIEVRFIGSDLGDGSLVEAGVDDFALLTDDEVTVAVGDAHAPAVTFLADARPNPFNPRTTISYGIAAAGDVRLDIFDVSGRLVRTLVDHNQVAGTYSVVFDGQDATGHTLASGVYYTRLTTAAGVVQQKKLTLLK